MRNKIKTRAFSGTPRRAWQLSAIAAITSLPSHAVLIDGIEVILDGYAYAVNSDIDININQLFVYIEDSDIENCQRPNGQLPLNTANMTLITNNQGIGIDQFRYAIDSRLLFLTTETSDVVCNNGLFVDQIFAQGFEPPNLIFSDGFDS